tara:strand:- start:813 stop:1286 length:474 start_codon:yes stop_codon:yes gene_type:complete
MTIWNNKNGSSTTNWAVDDEGVIQTNWSTKTNNTPADVYGTFDNNTSVKGTYSSVARAASSLIGGKYHLFDDVDFKLGTDSDYTFKHNTTTGGFQINGDNSSDKFFYITNGNEELMSVNHEGVLSLKGGFKLDSVSELPAAETGRLSFYNSKLYIAT